MDQKFKQMLKAGVFIFALMLMSACSHSKPDGSELGQSSDPASDGLEEESAVTDEVPTMDPSADQPPAEEMAASDPASEIPQADPAADQAPNQAPNQATEQPPADPALSEQPTEIPAEAPASDQNTDQNLADSTLQPAPEALEANANPQTNEEAMVDPSMNSEPDAVVAGNHKKKRKKHKKPTGDAAMGYSVKRGDTLMKIAFEQYGDLYRWKEIYESNKDKIQDPNHIPPGTSLALDGAGMVSIEQNGEQYLIKRGDTLGTISTDVYGTSRKWKRLWENNRQLIKDPNKIYAGFYLFYQPEGKLTETPSDIQAPAIEEPAAKQTASDDTREPSAVKQ